MASMKTVNEIIDAAGPQRIHERLVDMARRRMIAKAVGPTAITKWRVNGIPEKHWPVVTELAGVTAEEIHQANLHLRAEKAGDKFLQGFKEAV